MSNYIYYCSNCKKVFGAGEEKAGTEKICSECGMKLKSTGFLLDDWNEMDAEEREDWKARWEEENEQARLERIRKIPVTTADLKIEYIIVGPIYTCAGMAADGSDSFAECVQNLKQQAYDKGADAVVGMKMEMTDGKMVMYGTAIRRKRAKKQ